MRGKLLCLGTGGFGLPIADQIRLIHKTGFEGTFFNWGDRISVDEFASIAREENVIFQSVHAPFWKMADIWGNDTEKANIALGELKACLDDCIRNEVPIMVTHAFIGFLDHTPTEIGLERIGELVRQAEGSGVKIAFENTEGIEYLDAIMETFTDRNTVGFCWDSGHQMCYNYDVDLLSKYGDRLIATHLNDNLGVRDLGGSITFHDDLHLLPFDGIADWDATAKRLDEIGFDGILTFELKRNSQEGRHENDKYLAMPIEGYIAECYARACRVAVKLKR